MAELKYTKLRQFDAGMLLFTAIGLSTITFYSSTAINTAIPNIQADLNASLSEVQWIINSFVIVLAVLVLITGSLGDLFGRRQTIMLGLGLFILGTSLAGLAPNPEVLIVFRSCQGLGAALLIPQSLALINNAYAANIKAKAIGIWGGVTSAMGILAPIISGILVDSFNWRAVFFSLLPLALTAVVLTIKYIPASSGSRSAKIDWLGISLISIGLFALTYGAIELNALAIGFGLMMLPLFFWVEKRQIAPLLDFTLFRNPEVLAANLFTLLLYGLVSALPLWLVIYLQQLQGQSATISGLGQLPLVICITIFSFFSGHLADRRGTRFVLVSGSLLVAMGCIYLALAADVSHNYWQALFPGLLLIGTGFGIFVPGLSKAALQVPDAYSGMASGFNNSGSRVAGLLSVALLGSLLVVQFTNALKQEFQTKPELPSAVQTAVLDQTDKLLDLKLPKTEDPAQTTVVKVAIKVAFIKAWRYQMLIMAGLALTASGCSLLILRGEDS